MVHHVVIPLIIIVILIAVLVITGEYSNPIVAIPSSAIVGFLVYRIAYVLYKTRGRNLYTYIGKTGKAIDNIPLHGEGYVLIEGEMWKAIAEEPLSEGDKVIVVGMEGLKLRVKKMNSHDKN